MLLKLVVALFTVVSAKELDGTIHYHTDRLDRRNYQPSFGQLCNNSLCLQKRKDSENHVPVLPLHELERRQRVASLQRMYIASQHYQPHIEHPSSSNDPIACRYPTCNHPPLKDTVRVIHNETCIRCPSRQLARISRNQRLAKVPLPKLKFCARPNDFVTNFPLMVLRGPLMGSHVGEGEHTITFKTLYPLPAKTCRYTLKVYALRCPSLPVMRHGAFYCTNENLWGSRCLLKCDNDFVLKNNHTMPYKCVKRKREAIWKVPSILPQCIGKAPPTTTTTTPPSTAMAPRDHTSPEKRRLACRWPRAPKNGWTACGLRGRWKKRLFVKENVPCYRGCTAGFIPSIPLEPFNRSRISCVGGSWLGFKDFECLSPTHDRDLSSNECRMIAERTANVHCRTSGADILCKLECPRGLVIPKKYESRAELHCGSHESGHEWPTCEERVPPMIVSGCEDVTIKNVTFPFRIEPPVFRSKFPGGEVNVSCDTSFIESFGRFAVACTAIDIQLQSKTTCSYTISSQATSCKPFTPGEHTIPRCRFPRHEVDFAAIDAFPVKSECEFICSPGYVIATSQTEDYSYTVCTEDGAWSLSDFDICQPQIPPKLVTPCVNQTLHAAEIPDGGLAFAKGTYEDVMGNLIRPRCNLETIPNFGVFHVLCRYNDIEFRVHTKCKFTVTALKV